jgi:UDPglucose 6-dehydrogenase
LLRAVQGINQEAQRRFVTRAGELLGGLDGRTVCIWGLAFKEDTDDLRESPSVAVADMLLERGATVHAHDPIALTNAAQRLPDAKLFEDQYDAARGADAVMLCTPWRVYLGTDFSRLANNMGGDLFLDGRNFLDADAVRAGGLRYEGIGKGRDRIPTPMPSALARRAGTGTS